MFRARYARNGAGISLGRRALALAVNRTVVVESFGGPEVLEVRETAEPHAGPGEVRVRVHVGALNPMDWALSSREQMATAFGVRLPSGFGNDIAGVVDEVGEGVSGFSVGDRVFGGALARAFADHVVVDPAKGQLHHTPEGLDDVAASTVEIAGKTAAVAIDALSLQPGETVLIGGAAGGVGVYAVQLARLAGARVIGTCSPDSFEFVRGLGAEPVAYGEGLVDRVRALAPGGVAAATDLFGTETVHAALALGVPAERISTIAASSEPDLPSRAVGGSQAAPGTAERIAGLIADGALTVPIAATYPLERIQDAVAFASARHAHGKVIITL